MPTARAPGTAGGGGEPQPTPWHTEILAQLTTLTSQLAQLAQTQSATAVTLATLTTRLANVEQWRRDQEDAETKRQQAQPQLLRANAQLLVGSLGCLLSIFLTLLAILASFLFSRVFR